MVTIYLILRFLYASDGSSYIFLYNPAHHSHHNTLPMRAFFVFIFSFISAFAQAGSKEISGRVIDVMNGDTIIIRDAQQKEHRIYLYGIDAPELNQPDGKEARAYLDRLLFARTYQARVVIEARTKNGNIIGTVYAAEQNSDQYADINGMMVMAGYAWASQHSGKRYRAVEQIARNRKIGLWANPKPLTPWDWRKKQK